MIDRESSENQINNQSIDSTNTNFIAIPDLNGGNVNNNISTIPDSNNVNNSSNMSLNDAIHNISEIKDTSKKKLILKK